MEVITIMLEVIFDSIVSLVSSITLIEFCLLFGLVLLVTISRRLGIIHTAIQEIRDAAAEVRDAVDPDSQDNTEPQGYVEPQRKVDPDSQDNTEPQRYIEPQRKVDPEERIYPQI
jgi:hypothetical protein